MASAGGEDWVYVLSQQETADDAEAEQAVTTATVTATATAAGEDVNNTPSKKNPDDDGETAAAATKEDAAAKLSEYNKAAAQSSYPYDGEGHRKQDEEKEEEEYPDYTPEDCYTPEELEVERAYQAYSEVLQRSYAAMIDDKLEIERAFEAYMAAVDRAAAKIDDHDDAAAAASDTDTGGQSRALDKSYYDRYGVWPGPYYRRDGGGSSAPGSLGLNSGYDRYGYGFPGASSYGPAPRSGYGYGFPGALYGPATGYGYGGYAGYGEPVYSYVPPASPRYQLVGCQAPPPAFNGSFYRPTLPLPYVYGTGLAAPGYAPVGLSQISTPLSALAGEPSPPAVAPTTTQQPPEPSAGH